MIGRIQTLILLVPLAMGCTYTRVTSFVDPGSRPASFHRIAVHAQVDDLSDRQAIQFALAEQLSSQNVQAMTLLSLAPPTRETTPGELEALLRAKDIDGVLEVRIAETGYLHTIDPVTSDTEITTKKGRDGRKSAVTHVSTSGGGSSFKAFGKLQVSLRSTGTGQIAWVGDADSRAFFSTFNPDWNMAFLLKAFARKTARKLVRTGLLQFGG